MNITQFAESHNQNPKNVTMYIFRHKKLFEGHVREVGKFKYLDDEAIRILENHYPSVSSTKTIENEELQKKYMKSLEQITILQNQLLQAQKQIGEFRANQLLIESQKAQLKSSDLLINQLRNDIEYLKQQCANLQSRSFFDFLFRRNKKGKTLNENHSAF